MAQLDTDEYFTGDQVAAQLAVHPVTVRKWRTQNTKAGCIKFGPPYVYRGPNVVYPVSLFRKWCSEVKMINGVPHMNLPVDAPVSLPVVLGEPSSEASNVG